MHRPRRPQTKLHRQGAIVILAAFLLAVIFACLALALDAGYICLLKSQLQRSADAAALAGVGELYQPMEGLVVTQISSPLSIEDARSAAQQYVLTNDASSERQTGRTVTVGLNPDNDANGDILIGRLFQPSNLQEPLTLTEDNPNSVTVRIPMNESHANGAIQLFFARVLGYDTAQLTQTATATIVGAPQLIPISTSIDHWNSLSTSTEDNYSFDSDQVSSGDDGIPELSIYPGAWNGQDLPPGNFGTIQVGEFLGTTTLRDQIAYGPSQADYDYHGGTLYEGMVFSGETGISAGMETAFLGGRADGTTYGSIIGHVRILPLYSTATGNGTNAQFTIVRFVPVRIMYAELQGKNKSVVVQPVTDENDLLGSIRLTR